MSTGFECDFIEVEPNKWYYILQNWDCPVGAFDWWEYATAYGPFNTEEKAKENLRDNHANPGGYSIYEYQEGFEPTPTLKKLIEESTIPNRRGFWFDER